MAHLLTVKFPWALRQRKEVNLSSAKEEMVSRTSKYVQNLKANNTEKYKQHLDKERARAKKNYLKVADMSQAEKAEQRRRWAEKKSAQRKRKRETEESTLQQGRKKIREMSVEEKREYEKKKKQNQRKKRAAKKKIKSNKSSTRTGNSRSTVFRRLQDIKLNMPRSPKAYASVVSSLTKNTTPKKQRELERKGLIKRGLFLDNSKNDGQSLSDINKAKTEQTNKKFESKKSAAKVMSRFFLARACRVNRLKYKDVKRMGLTAHMYSKANKKMSPQIKRKRTGLSEETEMTVKKFWYQISRPLPLKKRVKKKTPLHLLECSYMKAFKDFKKVHSEKIGYVTFIKLKPKNVRKLRMSERITCCCVKCENVKLLVKALNTASVRIVETKDSKLDIYNETDCSDLTLCSYKTFPKKECVERNCSNCGIEKLRKCYAPLIKKAGGQEIHCDQWKSVSEVRVGKGEEKVVKSVQLVTETKTIVEVERKLEEDVRSLSAHLFRAKWQQHMFALAKQTMPPKSAILVLDFAENYTCLMQNEAQSHHWALGQVTIHPIVAYVNTSEDVGQFTNIESFVFISNDRKHDAAAVATFSKTCFSDLKERFGTDRFIQFTDCCASQYRGKGSFVDISLATENVERNYFESSHGKSAADGVSAVVKNAATKAVLNNQAVIRNSEEFYQFCQEKLDKVGDGVFQSEVSKYNKSNRKFIYVEKDEIDIQRKCVDRINVKPIPGTMKIHSIKGVRPFEIKMRNLSCFCSACWSDNNEACKNINIVGTWQQSTLSKKANKTSDDSEKLSSHEDKNEENYEEYGGIDTGNRYGVGALNINYAVAQSLESFHQHEQLSKEAIKVFAQRVAAKGWGIKGDTPSDGNCCFWALSAQLDMVAGENITPAELRKSATNYLLEMPEIQKQEIRQFLTTDIKEYAYNMAKDGTYADHVLIHVMSQYLKRPIKIVSAEGPDVDVGVQHTKQTLVLGYLPAIKHYVSLEPKRYNPGEFVAVCLESAKKKKHIYMAKILDTDGEDIHLSFMVDKGDGVYTWPTKPDEWWQTKASVVRPLPDPVLSKKSTNDRQFFSFS